jgi:hypothetical protein
MFVYWIKEVADLSHMGEDTRKRDELVNILMRNNDLISNWSIMWFVDQ